MIPKIIHYCWFGNKEKPEDVKQYIEGWRRYHSDYEIIEWNETTFNIESNDYVREAYNEGKWAFVSDYVRLFALYNYGGIYLDTDVEVLKPYDGLLENKAFIGVESKYSMCTATIGAEKESNFIKKVIDSYDGEHFVGDSGAVMVPNSQRIYKILCDQYGYKYDPNTGVLELGDVTVYSQDYFSPINCYTMKCNCSDNTMSIHRYAGTWKDKKSKIKDSFMALVTRIIGEENREKIKRKVVETK